MTALWGLNVVMLERASSEGAEEAKAWKSQEFTIKCQNNSQPSVGGY